jgi:hypothetical protein
MAHCGYIMCSTWWATCWNTVLVVIIVTLSEMISDPITIFSGFLPTKWSDFLNCGLTPIWNFNSETGLDGDRTRDQGHVEPARNSLTPPTLPLQSQVCWWAFECFFALARTCEYSYEFTRQASEVEFRIPSPMDRWVFEYCNQMSVCMLRHADDLDVAHSCSGGVVGYHASLTHWRSRIRFSARILLLKCQAGGKKNSPIPSPRFGGY